MTLKSDIAEIKHRAAERGQQLGLPEAPPFHETFLEFLPTFFTDLDRFTWGHLWFVAYLFTFSLLYLPLFSRMTRNESQRIAPTINDNQTWSSAWAYVPALPLALIQVVLRPYWPGVQNLYDDWANFAYYSTFLIDDDALLGEEGVTAEAEGREVVALLAELPDLWDVNIAQFPADARTARFAEEGAQEDYIAFVKQVTTKPVVTVGRYTSPDRMVAIIRKGLVDMIGAARPSIADPFLPKKIEEGRLEDIRECIGCNVCIMGDGLGSPIRCTQNS